MRCTICWSQRPKGDLEELEEFPAQVSWWRRARETATRRHNPLFDLDGVGPDLFCVDALHTLYLGPARDWLGGSVWLIIDQKVLATGTDQTTVAQNTLLRIRRMLTPWYLQRSKDHPEEDISRIENLELGMIGPRSKPMFSTKAAETKGLVPFMVQLLRDHITELGQAGRPFLRIGEAMEKLILLMRHSPRVVTVSQAQGFHDAFNALWRNWQLSKLAMKPKLHLLAHMISRSTESGNPGMHTTFEDESLNRVVAQLGRTAHRHVFEARIFASFAKRQETEDRKKRRGA